MNRDISTLSVSHVRKQNRRVYSFIKQPDFTLEPQSQQILNAIEQAKAITREELVPKLALVLETRNTISAVLSYHQRFLVRFGCIRIEELEEYKERTGITYES